MKKSILLAALLLFISISYAQIDRSKQPEPGPAPEINLKSPNTFELSNGLKVMIVENHKLPRVSITLSLDNPPVLEGDKAGVSSLTGSLLGNGSKAIDKDTFNEEIDYLGASINFSSQGGFASSLSKYFPRILELMTDAAIHPNFTQEEFDKEKEKLIEGINANEKSVSVAARRVENALIYGTDHPYGEFISKESVNNVVLDDVVKFYNTYFSPQNGYLVIIGDINFKTTKKLVKKSFGKWEASQVPNINFPKPKNLQTPEINFVDMPNAVQSEITVENVVDLQMKDADYFPLLIANKILGGGGEARLFLNLREDKGYTYGSYSGIGADKYASRFKATASVRNMVTDSSVVELIKEIKKIGNEPVTDEELANAKAKYAGSFVLALEKPQTIAKYALNIETKNLPEDFYQTYLEKISNVSKEDVQRVAKKYFMVNNARIVVTGKGSEVLENLEKTGIPIKYYDKYGNASEKPEFNKPIPENVNAKTVLNKYIEAIGGKEKLESVSSVFIKANGSIQGMTLDLELKNTNKNQFAMDIKLGGNSMTKQVFDGEQGYAITQGQKIDFGEDQINDFKKNSVPFPELNYLNDSNVLLEKIETIGGKDYYIIKVSDKKTIYYDADSGLKTKEMEVTSMNGQEIITTTVLDNFKEVGDVKFPFTISQSFGPQKVDFEVIEVLVNEGVSEADFK